MYSIIDYVATEGQENFSIPFGYLDQSHIYVYISGVEVDSQFLVFNTPTVVTLTDVDEDTPHPDVPEGVTVRVRRITPIDEPIVDYANGSNLGETDLDTQGLQTLYAAQEVADATEFLDEDMILEQQADAIVAIQAQQALSIAAVEAQETTSIAAVAAQEATSIAAVEAQEAASIAAVEAQEAASIAAVQAQQATSVTAVQAAQSTAETAVGALVTQAEAARDAAQTAETNAETAETNAETAQAAAEAARDAAITAKTAAETAETNAETAETNAETAQAAAEAARDEIEPVADAISGIQSAGDMILGAGSGSVGILGIGVEDGQVLVVNSDSAVGANWAGPIEDNPIINGAMEVWQRGTSQSSIASGAFIADRWKFAKDAGVAAVYDVSRSTDVPTFAQAGVKFNYSMKLDVAIADNALAAGDYVDIVQGIEGFNWRHFAERQLVLSFWVKATKTGTYCVALSNGGYDRTYVAEYTVNTTNTWEKKTVIISASPSAGTWNYNTSLGVELRFTLAAGSTFQTTANAWQTGNYLATANQVNAMDSTSNDFFLTGVQLEFGLFPTPFKFRNYKHELALCQRYYQADHLCMTYGNVTTGIVHLYMLPLRVEMRAAPTMAFTNASDAGFTGNVSVNTASLEAILIQCTSTSTVSVGFKYGSYTADAEL